jgi:TPP-dependent pyruvate/acetoin dehydrogenase alpha subunit
MVPSRKEKLLLLRDMLRIRRLQLKIEELYHLDEMKTPVHLYIGQEAIAVGVCAHLKRDDYIMSNHRSHGHYIAKGGDMKRLVAELYCKDTGCSRGFGGSMHLVDTSVGHMGSSSIVSGGIPIGVGQALAIKMMKENRISVIFFGDGAADEGALYESVNFALLKKLPVVFILENNQYSVCSPVTARQEGKVLFHYMAEDRLPPALIDGNDVMKVYRTVGEAVTRARRGDGPSFIECVTYRMRGHAGAGSDTQLGYRTEEEIARWEEKDPIAKFQVNLLLEGVITPEDVVSITGEIDLEVDEAFKFAQESPLPPRGQLARFLFRE